MCLSGEYSRIHRENYEWFPGLKEIVSSIYFNNDLLELKVSDHLVDYVKDNYVALGIWLERNREKFRPKENGLN